MLVVAAVSVALSGCSGNANEVELKPESASLKGKLSMSFEERKDMTEKNSIGKVPATVVKYTVKNTGDQPIELANAEVSTGVSGQGLVNIDLSKLPKDYPSKSCCTLDTHTLKPGESAYGYTAVNLTSGKVEASAEDASSHERYAVTFPAKGTVFEKK